MEPSINKSGIFAPDFSERDTVMTNNRLKGFTYGAVAAASYGMNPLFALPLYGAGMSVDSVLFYRYFFAVVMLGILMKVKKQSFALKKADILPLAVMGLLFSFSSFFLFASYNYMDAGIASTILFVYPVLVAIIMAVFFHEKVSFITMFSIALAFTGISLLYEGGDGKTLSMLGVLFVILSSLTYAIYIVGVNRSSLKELPTAKLTFYALLFGISIYGASGLLHGFAARPFAGAVGKCPFAGFVSHYHFVGADDALHPPHRLHAGCHIGALEPVTALFFGVVVFGEQLTPRIMLGVLMILTAVTLIIAAKPLLQLVRRRIG